MCDRVLQLKFYEILIRFYGSNQRISKKVKVFQWRFQEKEEEEKKERKI